MSRTELRAVLVAALCVGAAMWSSSGLRYVLLAACVVAAVVAAVVRREEP